jgi:ornithine cyclodeaminase/alanine dehydrogenase-like protein (mu-crystallin family)
MTGERLPFVSGRRMRELLRPGDAVEAVEAALRAGLEPSGDPARTIVEAAHGQLLLMPSKSADHVGVKIVSVAPANPSQGLPRIQGLYVLVDAATLAPLALLDGAALTTLRTPAVSVAAVRSALLDEQRRGAAGLRVVVFGHGPQAVAHVQTLLDVVPPQQPISGVRYLVRELDVADVPRPPGVAVEVLPSRGAEADRAVTEADVIVCATTAREPLFDGGTVRDGVIVVAVGSHEPDAREVDGELAGRAQVVVEDVTTALRENGDVVLAIGEGRLRAEDLLPMREAVRGRVALRPDRPLLFTSTGMGWEDLVVASAVFQRWSADQVVDR